MSGCPPISRSSGSRGSDLWLLVLDLPSGSRVEYKFEVDEDHGTLLLQDPRNPKLATNPFGANSVCQAAGYKVPDWVFPDHGAPGGTFRDLEIESAAMGRVVPLTLYLPAGFHADGGPYPLLVVHDGGDYLRYASLQAVLDNLMHRGMVPPLVAACLHPGDRLVEYADDGRHARFLADELLPRLQAELPVAADPARRCLMGASFGAVASLAAASRYPGRFGRLLLQSGSFAWSSNGCSDRRGPIWAPVKAFVDRYTAEPTRVAERVYVTCGVYESLICENRALVPALERTGMAVRLVEALDGHNWECWRDCLGDALSWLMADG